MVIGESTANLKIAKFLSTVHAQYAMRINFNRQILSSPIAHFAYSATFNHAQNFRYTVCNASILVDCTLYLMKARVQGPLQHIGHDEGERRGRVPHQLNEVWITKPVDPTTLSFAKNGGEAPAPLHAIKPCQCLVSVSVVGYTPL